MINLKQHLSVKAAGRYWHCLMDEAGRVEVGGRAAETCMLRMRVEGAKLGYARDVLLFSAKGEREGLITMARRKWMQLLSFLGMITIFLAVVSCDAGATQGICAHRNELMIGSAGIMVALLGLRIGTRKAKGKLPQT